jgi:DNA-binding FadR family transcriptional regulator
MPAAKEHATIPNSGKAVWIAESIRSKIATGKLKPGDALPPEPVLMASYDVSPPTMRAALRILESEGLVRIHRGAKGGPRVQELDVDVLAKRAGFYLQVEGAGLPDLLEALLLLQPGAVGLAELRRCVSRAEACTTMQEFAEVAADFVVLLLEASGNKSVKLFALVINSLIHQELHRWLDGGGSADQIGFNARRFREVVDLIESGDGDAAAALWHAHMLSTITPDLKPPRTRAGKTTAARRNGSRR